MDTCITLICASLVLISIIFICLIWLVDNKVIITIAAIVIPIILIAISYAVLSRKNIKGGLSAEKANEVNTRLKELNHTINNSFDNSPEYNEAMVEYRKLTAEKREDKTFCDGIVQEQEDAKMTGWKARLDCETNPHVKDHYKNPAFVILTKKDIDKINHPPIIRPVRLNPDPEQNNGLGAGLLLAIKKWLF